MRLSELGQGVVGGGLSPPHGTVTTRVRGSAFLTSSETKPEGTHQPCGVDGQTGASHPQGLVIVRRDRGLGVLASSEARQNRQPLVRPLQVLGQQMQVSHGRTHFAVSEDEREADQVATLLQVLRCEGVP